MFHAHSVVATTTCTPHAAFQSPRANGAHDFPRGANRSIHVPTGNFPFAPLEKWRRFFWFSLHRWEKDGVASHKTLYYRSSTSTLYRARALVLEDYPCVGAGGGLLVGKRAQEVLEKQRKKGKIIIIIINKKLTSKINMKKRKKINI